MVRIGKTGREVVTKLDYQARREVVKKLDYLDYHDETCLIITINDTFIGDLPRIPLIITISDTCKNQTKLDFDNTINL